MQTRSSFSSVRQLLLLALFAIVVSEGLLYCFAQLPGIEAVPKGPLKGQNVDEGAPGAKGGKFGGLPILGGPKAKQAAGDQDQDQDQDQLQEVDMKQKQGKGGLLGGLLGGKGKGKGGFLGGKGKGKNKVPLEPILNIGRGPQKQPQTVGEALYQAKVNPENEPGDLKLGLQELLQADLWLGQDEKPIWQAPQLGQQLAQQKQQQNQEENQDGDEEAARRRLLLARLARLLQKRQQDEQEQDHNEGDRFDDNLEREQGQGPEKRQALRRELSLRRHERKGDFPQNNNVDEDDQDNVGEGKFHNN